MCAAPRHPVVCCVSATLLLDRACHHMTCYRAAAEAAQQQETDAKARVQQLSGELRDTQGQLAQRKQVLIVKAKAVRLGGPCQLTDLQLLQQLGGLA
jgi:hypothetical protein